MYLLTNLFTLFFIVQQIYDLIILRVHYLLCNQNVIQVSYEVKISSK